MLRLQGAIGAETYDIQIERQSNPQKPVYECVITGLGDQPHRFSVRVISRIRNRWTLDVEGSIHDLVVSRYNGRVLVDWDNRNYQLSMLDPRDQLSSTKHLVGEDIGFVKAPMAGRVISVACGPGDQVATGESLATLEAMKMLNQIKAPRAGVVRKCGIEAGQSVKAGEILFELE